jgi:hypothetical protein
MAATRVESQQLFTKADWPPWYSSVIRRAKIYGILEYCYPELIEEISVVASSTLKTKALCNIVLDDPLIDGSFTDEIRALYGPECALGSTFKIINHLY